MTQLTAAAKEEFQKTLEHDVQQTESLLMSSGVIRFMPSDNKINKIAGIGQLELSKIDGRNPDKHVIDYELNQRNFVKERWSATVRIDKKTDVNELFLNPQSDIYRELRSSKNRLMDRTAVKAVRSPVEVGDKFTSTTFLTAAQDGVQTVDATAGLGFQHITKLTQNFINQGHQITALSGMHIGATGVENTRLMNEDKFTRSNFTSARPVDTGMVDKVSMYNIVYFPGSVDGGLQVENPIIPEEAGARYCPVFTKDSIAMAVEVPQEYTVEKSAGKINSLDLTVEVLIGAMRIQGTGVQILKTNTAAFS